jgi:hypothetical protein
MAEQDLTGTEAGDKVRIRTGPYAGRRGIVGDVQGNSVLLRLDEGEETLIRLDGITNYSLAARRAWEVMPKNAGRPASASSNKRMVSIRLDSQVWDLLGEAVNLGLIPSREQAINAWLRQRAEELAGQVAALKRQDAEDSNA